MPPQEIADRFQKTDLQIVAMDESANSPIEANKLPFAWQDLHHPDLARLRRSCSLDEVIAPARDELEQLLLLRHWVHHIVPKGSPEWTPDDPALLPDLAQEGRAFYCTHYSLTLMYAATALGWPARHVGVDCDHAEGQESTHHGVTDVFCFSLNKWIILDAMFDVHYEHDGVPLNALEIRNTFRNGGAIDICHGPERRKITASGKRTPPGFDEPACYFWFLIRSRNNYFTQPSWQHNDRMLLFRDPVNADKTWYQNRNDEKGRFAGSRPHTGYVQGTFQETEYVPDVFPPLGQTHITADLSLPRPPKQPVLPLQLYTICPYFQHFQVRFDQQGPWLPVKRRIDWRIHPGSNTVEARLLAACNHPGPIARIDIQTQPRPAATEPARHEPAPP